MAKTIKKKEITEIKSDPIIETKKTGRKKKEIEDVIDQQEIIEPINNEIVDTQEEKINSKDDVIVQIKEEENLVNTELINENEKPKEIIEQGLEITESKVEEEISERKIYSLNEIEDQLSYQGKKYYDYLVYTRQSPGQFMQHYTKHKFLWAVEEVNEMLSKNNISWDEVLKQRT